MSDHGSSSLLCLFWTNLSLCVCVCMCVCLCISMLPCECMEARGQCPGPSSISSPLPSLNWFSPPPPVTYLFLFYIYECLAYFHLYAPHACCALGGGGVIRSPATGVRDGREPPEGCWESNPVLLEQPVLLTFKSSLQLLPYFLRQTWLPRLAG